MSALFRQQYVAQCSGMNPFPSVTYFSTAGGLVVRNLVDVRVENQPVVTG